MLRQSFKLPWRGANAIKQCAALLSTAASDADEIISYVRSQGKVRPACDDMHTLTTWDEARRASEHVVLTWT